MVVAAAASALGGVAHRLGFNSMPSIGRLARVYSSALNGGPRTGPTSTPRAMGSGLIGAAGRAGYSWQAGALEGRFSSRGRPL